MSCTEKQKNCGEEDSPNQGSIFHINLSLGEAGLASIRVGGKRTSLHVFRG